MLEVTECTYSQRFEYQGRDDLPRSMVKCSEVSELRARSGGLGVYEKLGNDTNDSSDHIDKRNCQT